ncbi:DUF4192 domain-containing protein [Streptomyces sp. URMC 123]|uniref:DUF4192 domain-containing protein n=1 Tax=Streptomyces sp. URMC 123 TaxID=3423403 RepID=UPI003F1A121F
MSKHIDSPQPPAEGQVTLRTPAELADALPFLMGFHPTDSVVMVAVHGDRGRFGGRLRLGIPPVREEWPDVADQLAECLITGSEKRATRPDGVIVFLCQDPEGAETGREVMERLRPLAQRLRTACGARDVPVLEALCISDGRYWSYCCPDQRCCPREGAPLALPGTSVMAAAAAYAGIQVRGSLREMEARFAPLTGPRARAQEEALDAAAVELVPRILGGVDTETVRGETMALAERLLKRFEQAPAPDGRGVHAADARDDGLLEPHEAATLLLGLQDRMARDRAAEWMEGPEAEPALRLWRALARRCVGAYVDHAAPPLTLAGWVSWSLGDGPTARVALALALRRDPDYLFAKLLHQAANDGMDPEMLRHCLRQERADRSAASNAPCDTEVPGPSTAPEASGRADRADRRARTARRDARGAVVSPPTPGAPRSRTRPGTGPAARRRVPRGSGRRGARNCR